MLNLRNSLYLYLTVIVDQYVVNGIENLSLIWYHWKNHLSVLTTSVIQSIYSCDYSNTCSAMTCMLTWHFNPAWHERMTGSWVKTAYLRQPLHTWSETLYIYTVVFLHCMKLNCTFFLFFFRYSDLKFSMAQSMPALSIMIFPIKA